MNRSLSRSHNGDKLNFIFETVAEIFKPISPAITAAGFLKAILAVAAQLKIAESGSELLLLIELIAESPLYYLPLLLAYSSAKRLGCNIPCALAVGGMLIHPEMLHLVETVIGDFSVYDRYTVDYSFSVFPIIISIMFMSFVEHLCDRIKIKQVRFFLKPTLSITVTGVFALGVLGPVGLLLGEGITSLIGLSNAKIPWLTPTLIGALYPLMMLTSTQYSLVPLGINNIVLLGYDRFVGPGMLVSNIAQSGASLATAFVSKNVDEKRHALSASLTAFLGVAEPAMYSVNLKKRGSLLTVIGAGGVAGFLMGITGVKRYTTATPGIIALTGYIGHYDYDNLINTVIAIITAFFIGFLGTMFLSMNIKDKISEGENMSLFSRKKNRVVLLSPLSGKTVELSDVNDPTFAEKILGDGTAIIPYEGELCSPLDGVVESIAETSHAIAISGDNGAEVLMHIGIDTVELKGEGFSVKVSVGERVKAGDVLIDFDIDIIKSAGYETVTPIIITNSDNYSRISSAKGAISVGDELLELTE